MTEVEISDKSRLATSLFAFFLGGLGIHRFYLGKYGTAIAMLCLGLVGGITALIAVGFLLLIPVAVWAFVDFILAVSGIMKDKEGRLIKRW